MMAAVLDQQWIPLATVNVIGNQVSYTIMSSDLQ